MANNNKKETIIKVDNLVIYAKNVKITKEEEESEDSRRNRDPWGIFWGRQQREGLYIEGKEE